MNVRLIGILYPPTPNGMMSIGGESQGWHLEVELVSQGAAHLFQKYAKLTEVHGMQHLVHSRVRVDGVYQGIVGIENKGPLVTVHGIWPA